LKWNSGEIQLNEVWKWKLRSHGPGGTGLGMFEVLVVSGALYVLLVGGLYLLAADHVRRGIAAQASGAAEQGRGAGRGRTRARARARVVVPVTGSAQDLPFTLGSLLTQSHPAYELVMVTRDEDDPATPLARRLCGEAPHARHVLSGRAEGCGQKNHNLLKGLDAAGARPDILVFCDANHWAPPHFLENLVRPMEERGVVLASGYHRVRAGDAAMGTLGMLLSVMAIHMLQGIPFVTQPWGGATAVSAQVFESLKVPRVWAETVVDDYALGCLFLKAGIRCRPVSEACLLTEISGQSLAGWAAWLTRQLMYFKCFQPVLWVLAVPVALLLVLPLLLSMVGIAGAAAGWVDPRVALTAAAFVAAFAGLAPLFRRLVPESVPLTRWTAAFALMHFITAWCYAATWLTQRISWRGITYEVGRGGRVEKILYEEDPRDG
jgi:cellulose synthase/poly-beta-1,6-N-acetylglucosamine synthase-like glycosyltransferase